MFTQIVPKEKTYHSKTIIFIVILLLAMLGIHHPVSAEETTPVTVLLNGQQVKMKGQGAVLIGDTVYVPAINMFENLGVKVEWNELRKTLYGYQGETRRFEIKPGSGFGKLDEKNFMLDSPPKVINDTILVPSSFITQLLRYGTEFDNKANVLKINTEQIVAVDPYASYQKIKTELEQKYNISNKDDHFVGSNIHVNVGFFGDSFKECLSALRTVLYYWCLLK